MLNRPSNGLITRVVVLVGALLAISAVLLLSTQPQDVVLAHDLVNDPDHIHYSEIIVDDPQGDDFPPVVVFKSEDPEGRGVYWDVTGFDADDFEISSTGVLRFVDPPDFEDSSDRARDADNNVTPAITAIVGQDNMYQITVRATERETPGDPMGRALSTERHITVVVDNVEEKGDITLQWREPEVGTLMQAYLEDPDRGITNINVDFTWYVDKVGSGRPDPKVEGHWEMITLGTADDEGVSNTDNLPITEYLPRGKRSSDNPQNLVDASSVADEGKYLRVVATYYDGEHTQDSDDADTDDERKKAYGMSEFPVRSERTTGETGAENKSPDFLPRNRSISVYENLSVGSDLGSVVVAADPDTEDNLTYELVAFTGTNPDDPNSPAADFASDVDSFEIDRATGQIMVAEKLDFDDNPSVADPDGKYTITVKATDPSGDSATARVTIIAQDFNDSPSIDGASELRVMEADNDDADDDGSPDYTPLTGNNYEAIDEDRSRDRIRQWSLTGPDSAYFRTVAAPGDNSEVMLKFIDPPNYEAPWDADRDNVYKVMLTATDNNTGMDTKHVTVFVDNTQEAGKVVLYTGANADVPLADEASPILNQPLTAKVEDPDGGVTIVTWQWFKSQTEAGDIDITDGNVATDYVPIIGETSDTYTPKAMDVEEAVFLRARATYVDTLTGGDDPATAAFDERVQKNINAPDAAEPKDPDNANEGDMLLYEAEATTKNAVRQDAPVDEGPGTTDPTEQPDPLDCPSPDDPLMVPENAEEGAFVGSPFMSCSGGTAPLEYTLLSSGPDNKFFSLTDGVGSPDSPGAPQITVGSASRPNTTDMDPVLDYEDDPEFTVLIRVADSADSPQISSISVPVRLVNLNEVPFFDEASKAKMEVEHTEVNQDAPNIYRQEVATYVAIDPDDARNSSAIDWYVTGLDADDFEIANGQLRFVEPPNYENPTDRGLDLNDDGSFTDPGEFDPEDRDYQITIRATEASAVGGGPNKSVEMDVTVTVMNVDEAATVKLQWLQPEVQTPIMAVVTDPDYENGTITDNVTWQWYQSKVTPPNPNPDLTTLPLLGTEWTIIDVTDSNHDTLTYTPQGDDADTPADEGAVDEGKYLLALASYQEGGEARLAAGLSAYPVRADVTGIVNGSPNYIDDEISVNVPETRSKGGAVATIAVSNANKGDDDVLTYSLVAFGAGDGPTPDLANAAPNRMDVDFFEIDQATGAITLKKKLSFEDDDGRDHEGTPGTDAVAAGEYKFIVRATDPSGEYRVNTQGNVDPNGTNIRNRDDVAVIVMATEQDEDPVIEGGQAEITVDEADSDKEPEDPRYFVGPGLELNGTLGDASDPLRRVRSDDNPNLYRITDPDADDTGHVADVDGPDGHLLELVTWEGDRAEEPPLVGYRLQFKDLEPNYEDPQDGNKDNVYEVEIVIPSDENPGTKVRKHVTIEVMNIEEEGKLELTPVQPYIGEDADSTVAIAATLIDDDLTADMVDGDKVHTVTYWQWYWTGDDIDLDDYNGDGNDNDAIVNRETGDMEVVGSLTLDAETGNLVRGTGDTAVHVAGKIDGATMGTYVANDDYIGRFLHARVEYRDGWSLTDDPATADDERNNDDPRTTDVTEEPVDGFDSDEMLDGKTDNAVQTDPGEPTGPGGPGPGPGGPPDPTVRSERLEVAENTPGTGYVGAPVGLMAGLTYELGGTDGTKFEFADGLVERSGDGNPTDSDAYAGDNWQLKPGQIAVALSPEVTDLDHESDNNAYEVVITGNGVVGEDTEGMKDIIMVEIVVMDTNEAPEEPTTLAGNLEITGQASVSRDEGDSLAVATYRVVGADAQDAIWQPLAGADAGDFDLNNGVLTFKEAPDFEAPVDDGANNVYQVRLSANDAQGQSYRKEVVVIIANKNEDGVVTLSTDMPTVSGGITAMLDDPDGDVTNVMWQWYRAKMAEGPYTMIMDATDATYTPMGAAAEDDPATTDVDETDDVDEEMFLRATASYDDGHGPGKSAMGTTAGAVGVIPDNEGMVNFLSSQPVAGTPLTAMLTDGDLPITMLEWQWATSDAMDGTFTDIIGATAASYTPREAVEDDPMTIGVDETSAGDVGMYLRATAMYNDSHGDGKSAMMVTTNAVITAPVDPCIAPLGPLAKSETVTGTWASDCMSEARTGRYARYYTFTLASDMQVEMNLTSGTDPYLVLREGEGRTGRMVDSNDNVGSRNFNSAINLMLDAGTYTVEATTYFAGQTGDFTLWVRPLLGMENLGTLTGSVDRSNSMWVSDYMSTQRMMDSYARSYTFTLTTETHVAINLTAPEDPYLFLLDSSGMVVHESDNITTRNLNSRIDETLAAGTYTIEATTYFPARMGTFHLSIGVIP